jgi:hypothetical protein
MRGRRGLSLFELTVALFVMTAAMTAIVQLLAVAASQRRTIEQRRVALAEISNRAERIAFQSWDELLPGEAAPWDLSPASKISLPHATATSEIREQNETVLARQIRLIVRSPNSAGQVVELAELTVWKYGPGDEP